MLSCCAAALPNPAAGLRRSVWRDPRVQDEISSWALALGTDRNSLQHSLFDLAHHWQEARTALLTPLRPYLKLSGLTQGWVVFVAGTRHADRFEVVARDDAGRTRQLYLRGDDEHQWQARLLESQAWRNVTFTASWPDGPSRRWRQRMCRVLAARAFAVDATLTTIECAHWRRRNAKPSSGAVEAEERVNVVVVPRPAAS